MVNKSPTNWFSKKQATVQTATSGSNFFSAHICDDRIIELCNTLINIEVSIDSKGYLFKYINQVLYNSMKINTELHKGHTMVPYHHIPKVGYAWIRVRSEEADFSTWNDLNLDLSSSVYGVLGEIIPHNSQAPLVKYFILTHYVDAKRMHDVITGQHNSPWDLGVHIRSQSTMFGHNKSVDRSMQVDPELHKRHTMLT
jgi:hypothetical protein